MNILGLHFGHDAAVSVLRDGRIAAYICRERYSRTKHAISLEFKNIQAAIQAADIRPDQIDYCAITSTQNIELIIDDPSNFQIRFETHPDHQAPCTLLDLVKAQNINPATLLVHSLMDIFYNPRLRDSYLHRHYGHAFPEYRTHQPGDFTAFGWMDQQIDSPLWRGGTLGQIADGDFSTLIQDDAGRHGFHYPVTVQLAGRDVPGYYIGHHMAHAASNYYQSGFEQAAILTHDGFTHGAGYLGGMFFWAEANRIYPLTPHHLAIGGLYEAVGLRIGMGDVGPPGKLMGLAAYGQPRFFDRRFVGNQYDWDHAGLGTQRWMDHCVRLAGEMGYDTQPLGDPSRATEPINVDVAASTQKLFEETYLLAVEALYKVIRRLGRQTRNLCLSGGCSLNCPTNSRIFREGPFGQVFVEPGCDDSGLAIGAAGFLFYNVLNQPLPPRQSHGFATPYLGVPVTRDRIAAALESVREHVTIEESPDAPKAAAEDLVSDRVIGWFEGSSEIGPRALGHRSILADPRRAENWPRVNQLKGREFWRPFAPVVLESEATRWFLGMPTPSPYMLFTATVRSNQLPAVTHADGSARIQTVNPTNGEFFRVIEQFYEKTGVPVVLNTSFNGPGEPIVESPEDALRFLIQSSLDTLYIGGYRVSRRTVPI